MHSVRRLFLTALISVALSPAAVAAQLAASEVAFAEGLLALQTGDLALAADRFARAAELNPEDDAPRRWRDLTRARLETGQGASLEMAEPDWRPVPRAIDDRGLWEGIAGVWAAHDSNSNLFSRNLSLPPPDGDGLVRGEEADALGLLGARLGVYPWHAREGPSLGAVLEVQRSFHRDFSFLDAGRARGIVHAAFGSAPRGSLEGPLGTVRVPFGGSRLAVLVQAGGDRHQLGGASYRRSVEGAVSVTFRESPLTATRLGVSWADRDVYRAELADPRRSGEDLSFQAAQLVDLRRPDLSFHVGVRWLDRRTGPPFEGTSREGSAGLVWLPGQRWRLELAAGVREDEYERRESNLFDPLGPPRRDTLDRGSAALTWAPAGRLRWTVRADYANRDSNAGLEDGLDLGYRRLVVAAGLEWVF